MQNPLSYIFDRVLKKLLMENVKFQPCFLHYISKVIYKIETMNRFIFILKDVRVLDCQKRLLAGTSTCQLRNTLQTSSNWIQILYQFILTVHLWIQSIQYWIEKKCYWIGYFHEWCPRIGFSQTRADTKLHHRYSLFRRLILIYLWW